MKKEHMDYETWCTRIYAILGKSARFNAPTHPRFTKPDWWEAELRRAFYD